MHNPVIFFGGKDYETKSATWQGNFSTTHEPFVTLSLRYDFNSLIFPYQVHGTGGLVIEESTLHSAKSFKHEADWIITNVPGVGVGILTADCVPLLLYDPVKKAVGAVHAGWRGAVEGVVVNAIEGMRLAFGTQAQDLHVWIGPHARTCCYCVDTPFYETVLQKKYGTAAWHRTADALFFDLSNCCHDQLEQAGIQMINCIDSGICTICDESYCSYRREKETAQRNISIIGLRMSATLDISQDVG